MGSRKGPSKRAKHGIGFFEAQAAFEDPRRVIAVDVAHSSGGERRYFCIGRCGPGIDTVRFTFRRNLIRIFGAGYWTRGLKIYEKANQIHK